MAFTRVLSLNLYLVQTYIFSVLYSPGKKAVNYTDAPSRHFKKNFKLCPMELFEPEMGLLTDYRSQTFCPAILTHC